MGRLGSKVETLLVDALARRGIDRRQWEFSPKGSLGSPDLALTSETPPVAIFVDGCFWHGCPEHYKKPSKKTKWWLQKVTRNRVRDRGIGWPCIHCGEPTGMLPEQGWIVVRVWEHSIIDNADEAAAWVIAEVRRQRQILGASSSLSGIFEKDSAP